MRRTVIFHANHASALYQFVVLKNKLYRHRPVVLLINNINLKDTDFCRELVKQGVFKKIIAYLEPFDGYAGLTGMEAINEYFNKLFAENGLDINKVKKVITASDIQNWFGLYCVNHGVYPDFVEMVDDQFNNYYRYSGNRTTAGGPLWVEELSIEHYILTGDAPWVTKRYLCKNSTVKYPERDEIVDFNSEFFKLPARLKKRVARAAAVDGLSFSQCDLLLLNSFGWTKAKSGLEYAKHYLPYLIIADYAFDGSDNMLLLKDHPQTHPEYFKNKIATRHPTISSVVPIEFLGLIDGFRIKNLVSVNSTGNDKIAGFVDNQIKLGDGYFKIWKDMHKLYVTLQLSSLLKPQKNLYLCGVDIVALKAYLKCKGEDKRFDTVAELNCDTTDALVILNPKNEDETNRALSALVNSNADTMAFVWQAELVDKLLCDAPHMSPYIQKLTITKNKLIDDTLADTNEESLYVITKSQELLCCAKTFTISKELRHSGIVIDVVPNNT